MNQETLERLQRFDRLNLAVLGDFLLDEFIFGEISRVSREAPVLILSYRDSFFAPGGAANAVAGVAALGARVTPIGVIGDDESGRQLLSLWGPRVEQERVVKLTGHQTTRKTRILAGSTHSFRQQVVRLDHERHLRLDNELHQQLLQALHEVVPRVDGVILSDYALGTVDQHLRQAAIELARRHGKTVVVDSRFDPGGFPGATSITPNISEVEEALRLTIGDSDDELKLVGRRLREEWQVEALLITRGRLGMSLFTQDREVHIPIYGSDQVVDVTGAGDTVIATYTTALAAGSDFEEAARLANIAGGIVVSKKGTSVVTGDELRSAVARLQRALDES